jgi:hypothetical protein
LWLLLAHSVGPAVAQDADRAQLAKELEAYYQNGKAPGWSEAIRNLAVAKPEQRAGAAKYLVMLLDQAQKDELSGKAPWRATPFWGSSGTNPAHSLRDEIARELVKAPTAPAALTVVAWYLDREKVASFQETVMAALGKLHGQEADRFRLSLLQPVHENSAVVLAALEQIGKRKTIIPDGLLMAICDHHRPSLRMAARELNKERGAANPGPFDAAKALQRPALAKLMADIGVLLDRPAAPDAEFVKVTTNTVAGDRSDTSTTVGWLVKNDGASWEVLTPFGHRESFYKEKIVKRRETQIVTRSTWHNYPIAQEVKRVVDLRTHGDPGYKLSEKGGLTGQFQGRGASLYETMLAHWLYTARELDLAAQILLPALNTLYADRHLVDMVRQRVGQAAGYRMLVAFAGDRDFEETLRLASALVERYPETLFHDYAVKLLKELPRRRDDFRKFKLPTPAEWASLKKKLSRAEQITYLAERIRLLNCFQLGQPGEYVLGEEQFAEPCGLSRNAAWGLYNGQTRVINPYIELVGGPEGIENIFSAKSTKPSNGLQLIVADIPRLAPFLGEDWHLPCVSFWRDFAASRNLDTTRPVFVNIINDLARKDICSAYDMEHMTPVERERDIERISDWARMNSGKSEGTLLLEGLKEEWQPGKAHWHWLQTRFDRLVELKEMGAVTLLQRRLEDKKTSADEKARMLSCGRQLDAKSFKKHAEQLVQHESYDVQQQAALLLFATGARQQAYEAFARVLEKGDCGFRTQEVLDVLAIERTPAARKLMASITRNARMRTLQLERPHFLAFLAAAGVKETYLFYVPLLDIKGNAIDKTTYADGTVVGELIAREIIEKFAPTDPEIVRIDRRYRSAAEQIAPLKEWLKAMAKRLSAD